MIPRTRNSPRFPSSFPSRPAYRTSSWQRRPRGLATRASVLVSILALLTGACERSSVTTSQPIQEEVRMTVPDASYASAPSPTPGPRSMEMVAAAGGSQPPASRRVDARYERSASQQAPGDPVDLLSYLAYSYSMGLELPAERLAQTMDAHVTACASAGLHACQLITSRRFGDPQGEQRGELSLRAEPQWLERFMRSAEAGSRSAGGRVTERTTTTEDLTRAIIDTEAGLRAKRTLRDRLQNLLATRHGALKDLLEVESELARVQAEIDSTTSTLAAMRTRVVMSTLTVRYTPAPRVVASNTFEPLGFAVVTFVDGTVRSMAALVGILGLALPWVVVAGLGFWLVRIVRRRQRRTRIAEPVAPSEPPVAPAV